MADIVSRAKRSAMMSGIRGRNTQPEMLVRSHLHEAGLRYSLNARALPGRPDIVLRRWKVVVFVHGCFWHRHQGCKFAYHPKSNSGFWRAKFTENVARDQRKVSALRRAGWRVLTMWECRINERNLDLLVRQIRR